MSIYMFIIVYSVRSIAVLLALNLLALPPENFAKIGTLKILQF